MAAETDTETAAATATPVAEPKGKPAKAPKQKGKGKDSKQKPKGSKSEAGATGGGLSIAAHPRAARRVAQAKSWGGLIGFLIGGYLALPTDTFVGAALHALVAGVACYVAVWAGAVFLWRHLVVAELRSRQHEMIQAELSRRT